MVTVKLAKSQKHFADAFRIRAHVFVGEQKVPVDLEIDEYDHYVPIFVAYKGETALGTGRVIVKDDHGKMGRVAVAKEHRGSGVGGQLILAMIDYLKAQTDVKEVRLGAQVNAIRFYEKLGFETYGEIFTEANIEHISMRYQLRK